MAEEGVGHVVSEEKIHGEGDGGNQEGKPPTETPKDDEKKGRIERREGQSLGLQTVTDDRARASAGLLEGQQRLGRCGGGARTVGGDPSGHQRSVGAIDQPRSARPMDTSSTSRGSLQGRGRAWMRGQWVDMRGGCPGFARRCDTIRCP